MTDATAAMGFEEVRRLLPQKYPFLLIDRVMEIERGRRILCLKNVTGNEPYFRGHFPEFAVMPGALILESIAQAAIILFKESAGETAGRFSFEAIKGRILKPIFPGDQMRIEVRLENEKMIGRGGIAKGEVTVEGEVCVRGELSFTAASQQG